MKKIVALLAALAAIALFVPQTVQAGGGSRVGVSIGLPLPPVPVVYGGGYCYGPPAPFYYYRSARYYRPARFYRPGRIVITGGNRFYNRSGGFYRNARRHYR